MLETKRDSSGKFDWFTLHDRLTEAMQRASDLSLLDERKVLGDVIARGSQMQMVLRNAAAVLGLFSRMLPSIRGVAQEVAEADMAEMRKLHLMNRNQFSVLGAACYAGGNPGGEGVCRSGLRREEGAVARAETFAGGHTRRQQAQQCFPGGAHIRTTHPDAYGTSRPHRRRPLRPTASSDRRQAGG